MPASRPLYGVCFPTRPYNMEVSRTARWLLMTWLLSGALTVAQNREGLYPFGEEQGDQRLPIGDDMHSPEVSLQTPIAFFDHRYYSIYINTNGVLSFEREYPMYDRRLTFPVGVKLIAPFLADVDTRLSGNVFYRTTVKANHHYWPFVSSGGPMDYRYKGPVTRETMDPSLLELVSRDIQGLFPSMYQYTPTHLLVVTWQDVGYHRQQYDQTNTFQCVIASDGFESFVFFIYDDPGIQWITSQGKYGPDDPDTPAHVGFDAGDLVRYLMVPDSGTWDVNRIARNSNMGVPGKWAFHVGLVDTDIEQPSGYEGEDNSIDGSEPDPWNPNPTPQESCSSSGYHQCHSGASCVDQSAGFCCECQEPTYGNGFNCLQPNNALRMNGKVSGTVNNQQIVDQDLHAYVLTKDGRSYTAISRLPEALGVAMQAAYPVGGPIGWLFAAPTSPQAKNGAMMTGGNFNRTAVLRYLPGGQTLQINQQFVAGASGVISVTTMLNGEVPDILSGSEVSLNDYTETYEKEGPGVFRASSQHTYTVAGLPNRFMLDQTITFKEPCSAGVTHSTAPLRINVQRPYIVYGHDEEIVRYAMTNKATFAGDGGADPCAQATDCDTNAECQPDGERYTCRCKRGYEGDGYYCADEDECSYGTHGCDINAECYNQIGSYDCRCRAGYRGDGRTCERDLTCAELICDVNAVCVYDSDAGRPTCQCNAGYEGDGMYCEQVVFGCNEVNNCDRNADCVYNPSSGQYQCECMDGFSGDGYYCSDTGETDSCSNCDVNARCAFDVNRLYYRCQCLEEYTGDGYTCTYLGDESCNVLNNCDYNARCTWVGDGYACRCNPGYTGDGYRCDEDRPIPGPSTCESATDCHSDADCVYNRDYGQYTCVCNQGFSGDGYYCLEDNCNTQNLCDINAQCVYETYSQRYICRCNPGFEGDGRYCRQQDDCSLDLHCDVNAECMANPRDGLEYCRCKPGYVGNGYVCTPVGDCSLDQGLCDENAACTRRGNVYVCACNPGYRGDGRRCAPVGESASYLVYAQGKTMMQLPFTPTDEDQGKRVLDLTEQTAIGIDVDCYTRNVYWTDVSGKSISKAKLDGTDVQTLVTGLGSPEGVAIDWLSKNMYWTDSSLDRIECARLDGTHRTTLFDTELVNPRAIVVDPAMGMVFWSDWNRETPKIESAYMDGTNRQVVIQEGLGLPNGLTIDQEAQQLCWADAGTQHIECVSYEGRGRRVVYAFASYPFDLVYANDVFYWTDWDMNSLPSIDKYGGETNEDIVLPQGGNGRLYGIAAVREQCPQVSNACVLNNGGCRFLCLPTPHGGRTCLCPGDIPEEECNEIGLVV